MKQVLLYFILIFLNCYGEELKGDQYTKVVLLPKCKACEGLVESFLKGIERTGKENFAGGNTAWEESQLGTYANSEIRFVEIQESLCRENKTTMHQCQSLAEQFEDFLEQWWVKDRWEDPDLKNYLCVKKVKYCNSKMDSTKSSDDSRCPEGRKLNSSGDCEDVNECVTYPCEDHEFCVNTEGSFLCRPCHEDCAECFGPGADHCTVDRSLLHSFAESVVNLYNLCAVGPTFLVAYAFVILCGNVVFKIPLMPSLFLLTGLLFCVSVKLFIEEGYGSDSDL